MALGPGDPSRHPFARGPAPLGADERETRMTLATLDQPRQAVPSRAPRPSLRPSFQAEPLPELSEEQWERIQARLRATGVPVEAEDDQALARAVGISGLFGIALTTLTACGLWVLFT